MQRRSLIGLLFLLVACDKSEAAREGDRVEGRRILDQAIKESEGRDRVRREGLAKAKDIISPRPDLGPCPVKVKVPIFAGLDWQGKSVTTNGRLLEQMDDEANLIDSANVATAKGPKAAFLQDRMRPLGGILPPDDDPKSVSFPKIRALADAAGWTYDTTLIIDASVAPQEADDRHFAPGVVVGRIYTWSYKDEKVLCAADVLARSSAELKIVMTKGDKATDALMNDLRSAAMRAGIADLVAAGPRVTSADAGANDAGGRDAGKAR